MNSENNFYGLSILLTEKLSEEFQIEFVLIDVTSFTLGAAVSQSLNNTKYNIDWLNIGKDNATCKFLSTLDPGGTVHSIIVIENEKVTNSNQFSCLVNGGVSSPKCIEYTSIDEAVKDTDIVKNEVRGALISTYILSINCSRQSRQLKDNSRDLS